MDLERADESESRFDRYVEGIVSVIGHADRAGRTLQLRIHDASTPSEIDQAFATMVKDGGGALIVGADPFFGSRVGQIVGLANGHRIPAMYYRSEYAAAGGLISYGTSIGEPREQHGTGR